MVLRPAERPIYEFYRAEMLEARRMWRRFRKALVEVRKNLARVRIHFDPAEVAAVSLKATLSLPSDRVYVMPSHKDYEEHMKEQVWKHYKTQTEEATRRMADIIQKVRQADDETVVGEEDDEIRRNIHFRTASLDAGRVTDSE